MQATWLITDYPGNFYPNHLGQKAYKKGEVIYRLRGITVSHQQILLEHDVDTCHADSVYYHHELDRKRDLFEKKLISPQQWNQIQKQYTIVLANLKKANGSLKYFKLMTAYRAPFDGSLSQVQYPEGDYVPANSRIGYFWNPDSLKLVIPWYDANPALSTGQKVVLVLEDTVKVHGEIQYIDSSVNPASGSRAVWITLDSIPRGFYPEKPVSYSLVLNNTRSLAVPENAIIRDQDRYWVVRAVHGKYFPVQVGEVRFQNHWAFINDDLKAGDMVLTRGAYEIYHQQSPLRYQIQD